MTSVSNRSDRGRPAAKPPASLIQVLVQHPVTVRTVLEATDCELCVSHMLIWRCRSHNPAHRPTFEQIKKFVHRINPIKVSPVDMMMNLVTMAHSEGEDDVSKNH